MYLCTLCFQEAMENCTIQLKTMLFKDDSQIRDFHSMQAIFLAYLML